MLLLKTKETSLLLLYLQVLQKIDSSSKESSPRPFNLKTDLLQIQTLNFQPSKLTILLTPLPPHKISLKRQKIILMMSDWLITVELFLIALTWKMKRGFRPKLLLTLSLQKTVNLHLTFWPSSTRSRQGVALASWVLSKVFTILDTHLLLLVWKTSN